MTPSPHAAADASHLFAGDLASDLFAADLAADSAAEPRPVSVDSSNLEWVQYWPREEILQIVFNPVDKKTKRRSGKIRTYRYRGVPARVYEDLLAAPSKGQYFHQAIKGRYAFEGPL